jgi:hypothetical protein
MTDPSPARPGTREPSIPGAGQDALAALAEQIAADFAAFRSGDAAALSRLAGRVVPVLWQFTGEFRLDPAAAEVAVMYPLLSLARLAGPVGEPRAMLRRLAHSTRAAALRALRRCGGSEQSPGEPGPEDLDRALRDALTEPVTTVDPMPAGLLERIEFSLALADLDLELAWGTGDLREPSGEPGNAQVRTFACTSADLAILLTTTPGTGTCHLDGWLAPGAPLRLELRFRQGATAGYADTGCRSEFADPVGRFEFADVPAGLAQLVVHPTPGSPVTLRAAVVTPAIEL